MYQTFSNKVTLDDVMHALSNTLRFLIYIFVLYYTGSPTYPVFTTAVFGLCTLKWGIWVLIGDPLKQILGNMVKA